MATNSTRPDPRRSLRAKPSPQGGWRRTPLTAALASALPWLAPAEAAPPAPRTVPVPAVSWRVNGSGAAAPVNRPNAQGGVDQTIGQSSQRAIYQWNSFDIGAASSVTFDMALKGASALNRVVGGDGPSQIFGRLSATNGGELYLINANGILFGRGAQVNTGALIASALNIGDAEYLSGLTRSLLFDPSAPTFRYDGSADNFVDAKNFVRVDEGAHLATANGGRIFLFAKRVENAGTLSTPGGQTLLAAGGEVYLQPPNAQLALYASESNPNVPTLRGLLVEVGQGPGPLPDGASGSVVNLASGQINTPRGNATLVAMAVNQSGRISATSSVTENGSIILRAQGAANNAENVVRATQGGSLTLGPGSVTAITPDAARTADGRPLTSDGNATFVNPRIDLAGHDVRFETGAQVTAPGATVHVRAEQKPNYEPFDSVHYQGGSDSARIVLGAGAVIDVSGTMDATLSAARNFVTTELLGSSDLKDAPLQKEGLLARSKVTLDLRENSPILGDLSKYRLALQQGIEERLSVGGKVTLRAEGAVLTANSSQIDVSGGRVTYTSADVRPTLLMAQDGRLFDLNDAPADLTYRFGQNLQKGSLAGFDRWGVKIAHGTLTPQRHEPGYVEGRPAGSLSVVAPSVALLGGLDAHVEAGERQRAGTDARPTGGTLAIGALRQGTAEFGTPTYSGDAVLHRFEVSRDGPSITRALWDDPWFSALPANSGVREGILEAAGFAQIAIAANGPVAWRADADPAAPFALPPQGKLRLLSTQGEVSLGGAVQAAGGSVELRSLTGSVELREDARVDLSGAFVNQLLDGPRDTSSTHGGTFSAAAPRLVVLGSGSLVDVSGGAAVATNGSVQGGNAGTVSVSNTATDAVPSPGPTLMLDGRLRGASLATGGTLSLGAPMVRIGASPGSTGGDPQAADDGAAAALTLAPSLFTEGGFSSYAIDGRLTLDVAAGSHIAPRREAWTLDPRVAAVAPSGSATFALATPGLAVGALPGPVNIKLNASGLGNDKANGVLTVEQGASFDFIPQSQLGLSAASRLQFDGQVHAPAGKVSLDIWNASDGTTPTWLWLGAGSLIDVSGTTLLTPSTDGLRRGTVLDAGSIGLSASGVGSNAGSLVFAQGAQLRAGGSSDQLDQAVRTTGGVRTTRSTIDSAGGSVSFSSNRDLILEGDVQLQAGGVTGRAGSLAVSLQGGVDAQGQPSALRELSLTRARSDRTSAMAPERLAAPAVLGGDAAVSEALIARSGAADFAASAREVLRLEPGIALDLPGKLRLDTQVIAAEAGSPVRLGGAQVVINGLPPRQELLAAPLPGAGGGPAALNIDARADMILSGSLATQGMGQIALRSGGDLALQGLLDPVGGGFVGRLDTRADLTVSAKQVFPATQTRFTVSAPERSVVVTGGDSAAAPPLSAGGSLSIEAAQIDHGGVVRAPQGRIALTASGNLNLTAGSETSVSAAGQVLPYGQTSGERWLSPDGTVLDASPVKRIDLNATSLAVSKGARVDLSAGGDLVGYEFVPGSGGSRDLFVGGDGTFAIVPTGQGSAAIDPSLVGAAPPGRQIHIGSGAPVPAGTYTLLPARYGLQPGAFLVKAVTQAIPLAVGTTIMQVDGSALVGATLGDVGTQSVDARPSTWQITPVELARRSSEIRVANADQVFAARAQRAGIDLPERPVDAGSLRVATTSARLDGQVIFDAAATTTGGQTAGRGGRAEFAAGAIQIDGGTTASADDTLHLSAATLNALGAHTVLIGGNSASTSPSGTSVDVRAESVVFAQGAEALRIPDLVAVSTNRLSVNSGAQFEAPTPSTPSGGAPTTFQVAGDGAALRLSADPGAQVLRTESEGRTGRITIGAGSGFDASGGSLQIDSSRTTTIRPGVRLSASEIALAARVISVGESPPPSALALTPALSAQATEAKSLTLRAYDRIDVAAAAQFGSPALQQLTLDTPRVRVTGAPGPTASVTAGELELTNSTGRSVGPGPVGDGRLSLNASTASGGSGRLTLDDGSVAIGAVASVTLNADREIGFQGQHQLAVAGGLTLRSAGVVADTPAADATLRAGGTVRNERQGDRGSSTSAVGASLSVQAARIEQAGDLVLPSGQISLRGRDGVRFEDGSRTDVAGSRRVLDGVAVDVAGGTVRTHSELGDVNVGSGARIDVSGLGGADGGSLSLSAPAGAVRVRGELRGTPGDTARSGATLAIDTSAAFDLDALASRLAPDPASTANFSGGFALRQRQGDLELNASTTLKAREISLVADGGALRIAGHLEASAADGGRIELAARDNLTLTPTGALLARGTAVDGDGGRVELQTAQGRIVLARDSHIDLSAGGAAGDDGKLLLRAPRSGEGRRRPGTVAIAPLRGHIEGVGRIDVEAVKIYDNVQRVADFSDDATTLSTFTLQADGSRFVGTYGERARDMAARLANGDEGVLAAIRVHPGVEIRSQGTLAVDTGDAWALPSERWLVGLFGGDPTQVGDTTLTVRAAGNLVAARGISSGFASYPETADSGSIRLVAGADLRSAAVATTVAGGAGDVRLGRNRGTDRQTQIKTTTGDVVIAASGAIDLSAGQTTVFTTGVGSSDEGAAAARAAGVASPQAFNTDAGDVRLTAGTSVRSRTSYDQDGSRYPGHANQWFRTGLLSSFEGSAVETAYWSANLLNGGFQHGVGNFGGGDISVLAGTDVTNLAVAAPSSGWWTREPGGSPAAVHRYGGGNVRVQAGRDVVNGIVQAGGRALEVRAGRDVAFRATPGLIAADQTGLEMVYENTDVRIDARRHLTLGSVQSAYGLAGQWLSGLDADASLSVLARSGDLVYRNDAESTFDPVGDQSFDTPLVLLPAKVRMAAAAGSLSLHNDFVGGAYMLQQPQTRGAQFELLAARDLFVDQQLQVNAETAAPPDFHGRDGQGVAGSAWEALQLSALRRSNGQALDPSDGSPVRLIASTGDLTIARSVRSTRPLRAVAGGDLALDGDSTIVDLQHQPSRLDEQGVPVERSELSLLRSGRDLRFGRARLIVGGPGELVLLAGRDIDLGSGAGILSNGNNDNSTLLPASGSSITVVAGVRADGADLAQAAHKGFHAIGPATLGTHAGDLFVLLSASDGKQPKPGSATARQFDAKSPEERMALVRDLIGATSYDQGVAAYVRGLPGNAGLSETAALAAWDSLPSWRREPAAGAILSKSFALLPQQQRVAFISALAGVAANSKRASDLIEWMTLVTGRRMTLPAAIAEFEALPPERQAIRLNQVLIEELRTHGRDAAQAAGDARTAAYDRGFAAINMLFPLDRPDGDIRLPSSQLKTVQQASITLMAPGGGVNAGEVGASTKGPSELGIVTVAGGDIAAMTRDNFLVNQSRVFTLAAGDILLWSSAGDIDAGRGAKTVVGAPAPVFRLDASGRVVVDTSGSFSGSGIAVLDAKSALDLYAPAGAIDAGEAGIRALGDVYLGATVVRGADNIQLPASAVGAPAAVSTVGATAGLANAANSATVASRTDAGDEDERRKQRRARRSLLLEFLGFGGA